MSVLCKKNHTVYNMRSVSLYNIIYNIILYCAAYHKTNYIFSCQFFPRLCVYYMYIQTHSYILRYTSAPLDKQ